MDIISLKDGILREEGLRFGLPMNFTLVEGEHIAIVGVNGSGKTILIETLLGERFLKSGRLEYGFGGERQFVSDNVKYITFRDAYGSADAGYYYQQRWNASDRGNSPTVSELLGEIAADKGWRDELYTLLGIDRLLDKEIILLSSGELRRFQIARMLLQSPRVLIIENPFIGLDVQTRELFKDLMRRVILKSGIQIVLALSAPEDVPDFITHVYTVADRVCLPKRTLAQFMAEQDLTARATEIRERFVHEPMVLPSLRGITSACDEVVRMRNVTIRYGDRVILDSLDWTIRRGEKWTLTGTNGSGKSTLLSLICADNPQSYAQDITLFGRRRGTGESIWDIKREIGYVSPEMHRSYVKDIPSIDIVASGFFDSIGLYHTADDAQKAVCDEWLSAFGLSELRNRSFIRLSSGEQRMLLLARAFVKDPALLILDEPLHGLDCMNKERARGVIEAFCRREGKTLIYVTHYEHELPECVDRKMELIKRQ